MADPANDNADLAYHPPSQFTAYGPPPVVKMVVPTREPVPSDSPARPVASGITKRISE